MTSKTFAAPLDLTSAHAELSLSPLERRALAREEMAA